MAAPAAGTQSMSSRGAKVWAAAQRAYAEACSALPPPLSAQMAGAASPVRVWVHTDYELKLIVRLAAGGDGAELRFGHTHGLGWDGRAWALGVCWRPLPAPADGAKVSRGWRALALARTEDPPATGMPEVDTHMEGFEELEVYDTSGLTPAAVAALRVAVRGANEPPRSALRSRTSRSSRWRSPPAARWAWRSGATASSSWGASSPWATRGHGRLTMTTAMASTRQRTTWRTRMQTRNAPTHPASAGSSTRRTPRAARPPPRTHSTAATTARP